MSDPPREPERNAATSLRDLLVIGGVLVALFVLGAFLGFFEHLSDWLLTREQSGGVFALVTLLAVGAAIFAILRWRQALVETSRRVEAERRYRFLVEQSPAVSYSRTPVTSGGDATVFVSPQIEQLLGYSAEEWVADPGLWLERLHPDDRDDAVARSNTADTTGRPFHMEYRLIDREGAVVWVHDEARTVARDAQGLATLVQGILFDITRTKKAELERSETQRRFQALVERLPAITYIEDAATGRYRYVSPQIEQVTGYAVQAWIDDRDLWERTLHPDDRERVVTENDADTGDAWAVDYRMIARDGRTVWIHNESVLVRDAKGQPLEWVGVATDLTDQKVVEEQVRAAEERFRAMVEHIPAAIYLDHPDGRMQSIYVSPQIEAVMGITPQRFIEEPEVWLDLMDPEDRERCEPAYLAAIGARRSWVDEYRIRKPDGRSAWIHDETTFLTNAEGEPTFLLGVLYDVTERKRAEEALRGSERREREAAERLRALDEMKNTFLAAVSHELRSPLTSILGLSLTLERTTELPPEDRRDLITRLSANARKLDRLLKDLLDIDRLNRGIVAPQLRRCDVGALVTGTIESLDAAGGRVLVDAEPVELDLDAAKVERIVENLVTNAIRHVSAEGTIWVRVEAFEGGALLIVEDDGPGVPEELRTTIFEPFRQGPIAATHSPGTGIGLSLVGRFAELHSGRAWVEDRPGGGASFRVFLPGAAPDGTPSDGNGRVLASVEQAESR